MEKLKIAKNQLFSQFWLKSAVFRLKTLILDFFFSSKFQVKSAIFTVYSWIFLIFHENNRKCRKSRFFFNFLAKSANFSVFLKNYGRELCNFNEFHSSKSLDFQAFSSKISCKSSKFSSFSTSTTSSECQFPHLPALQHKPFVLLRKVDCEGVLHF